MDDVSRPSASERSSATRRLLPLSWTAIDGRRSCGAVPRPGSSYCPAASRALPCRLRHERRKPSGCAKSKRLQARSAGAARPMASGRPDAFSNASNERSEDFRDQNVLVMFGERAWPARIPRRLRPVAAVDGGAHANPGAPRPRAGRAPRAADRRRGRPLGAALSCRRHPGDHGAARLDHRRRCARPERISGPALPPPNSTRCARSTIRDRGMAPPPDGKAAKQPGLRVEGARAGRVARNSRGRRAPARPAGRACGMSSAGSVR